MWKHLGFILNSKNKCKQKNDIDKILENDQMISDKSLLPDIMNNYFCNIGKQLKSNLSPTNINSFKRYMPSRQENSFYLTPVNVEEIKVEILKLNPKKAAGNDEIRNKILHLCPEIFAKNLFQIYNKSIENGVYPSALK